MQMADEAFDDLLTALEWANASNEAGLDDAGDRRREPELGQGAAKLMVCRFEASRRTCQSRRRY